MRHHEDRVEVHRQQPVDVVEAELGEAAAERHPGVVDEQRDARVRVADRVRRRDRGVAVGEVDDVGLDGEVGARGAQLVAQRAEALGVPVEQHEAGAARRQLPSHRAADTACGPSHHGGTAVDHERPHARTRARLLQRTPLSWIAPLIITRRS